MTTRHLELPHPIDAKTGEHVRVVLDCVADSNGLRVEEMHLGHSLRNGDSAGEDDAFETMVNLAKEWPHGPLASATDAEIREMITSDKEAKHAR